MSGRRYRQARSGRVKQNTSVFVASYSGKSLEDLRWKQDNADQDNEPSEATDE